MKPKVTYAKADGRSGYDHCQTPPYAVDFLMKFVPPRHLSYWDPASGDGLLVRRLRELGFCAHGSDITDGLDFLVGDWPNADDMLIINPPFSRKYDFLKRCLDLGCSFALIMPVESLGTASMMKRMRPGMKFLIPNRRIGFKMPVKGWRCHPQFPTMWMVYDPLVSSDSNELVYGNMDVWKPEKLEDWEIRCD